MSKADPLRITELIYGDILQRLELGESIPCLAKAYHVSQRVIREIKDGTRSPLPNPTDPIQLALNNSRADALRDYRFLPRKNLQE
jgi:hypothetical protein